MLAINQEKFNSLTQVFPEFYSIMEPLLRDRTSKTLKTVPIFSDLTNETRNLISEMVQFSSFPTGMNILTEDMADDGLHILIDGRVTIKKKDASGVQIDLGAIEKGRYA